MILKEIETPLEWKDYLGNPDIHWRIGYSAKELAYCWQISYGKFPKEIQTVFNNNHLLFKKEYIFAIPEYKVGMPGKGGPSANDLFVLSEMNDGLCPIMVEGKSNESFDKTVFEWMDFNHNINKKENNKKIRFDEILNIIGLKYDNIDLNQHYYQLFHRTASALITAKKYHTNQCMVLIHHINGKDKKTYDDFKNFVSLYGISTRDIKENQIISVKVNGIKLMFVWVEDKTIYTKEFFQNLDTSFLNQTYDDKITLIGNHVDQNKKMIQVRIQSRDKTDLTLLKSFKNGLYFFYNKSNQLLYIGMVSSNNENLYMMIYGNGKASLSHKIWWNEVHAVYFYHWPNQDKKEIGMMSSILIKEKQPIYNDLTFSERELDDLYSQILTIKAR